jgi:hypothetical protein
MSMCRKPKTQHLKAISVPGELVWNVFDYMDGQDFIRVPKFGNVPDDAVLVGLHASDTIPHRFVFVFEHPDFPEVPPHVSLPLVAGELTSRVVEIKKPNP